MLMRVASYNVHRAVGSDGIEAPERIVSVLDGLQAQFIVLQEVGFSSPGIPDVPGYYGQSIGAQAIEGITLEDERGKYGNVVLSALPLDEHRVHDISVSGREPRGVIECFLRINDIPVQVLATHLGLTPGERRQQVRRLLSLANDCDFPLKILLGDMNEWFLWGRPARWLHRLFGQVPARATFPSRYPLLSLDRIWVSPRHALASTQVVRTALTRVASDHLPLVADIDTGRLAGAQPALDQH